MNEKKVICVVINSNWNILNFRANLLKYLQASGGEIHVVAPNDDFVSDIAALGFIYHEWNMQPKSKNLFSEIKAIMSLFAIINSIRPHYCLTFTIKPNMYTAFFSRLFKFKQIANVAGLGRVFSDNSLSARILQSVFWNILCTAFHIFFQNEDDKNKFVKTQTSRPMSFSVLPGSGVKIPTAPVPLRKRDETVFLMFCRLLKSKGVQEYALAAERVQAVYGKVRFQLLGFHDVDDPDSVTQSSLDDWETKSVIEYMGSTRDVSKYIIDSDCVVLPSYYPEGTPRSLLEAGSFGRAIITTDTPGCKNTVIPGISGYLVQPRNVDELTEALMRFLCLPFADRVKMSKHSFGHIKVNYDENIVLLEYKKFLNLE